VAFDCYHLLHWSRLIPNRCPVYNIVTVLSIQEFKYCFGPTNQKSDKNDYMKQYPLRALSNGWRGWEFGAVVAGKTMVRMAPL
jgi:hypothetical protein